MQVQTTRALSTGANWKFYYLLIINPLKKTLNFKFGSETNFGHIHLAADRWEKGVVDVEGVWRQYEGPKTLQGGGDTIDQSNSKKN